MGKGTTPPEKVSSGWEATSIQKPCDSPLVLIRLHARFLSVLVSHAPSPVLHSERG